MIYITILKNDSPSTPQINDNRLIKAKIINSGNFLNLDAMQDAAIENNLRFSYFINVESMRKAFY